MKPEAAVIADAISKNIGLRMALILVNKIDYEHNLADLSEALANDAVKALKAGGYTLTASKATQP